MKGLKEAEEAEDGGCADDDGEEEDDADFHCDSDSDDDVEDEDQEEFDRGVEEDPAIREARAAARLQELKAESLAKIVNSSQPSIPTCLQLPENLLGSNPTLHQQWREEQAKLERHDAQRTRRSDVDIIDLATVSAIRRQLEATWNSVVMKRVTFAGKEFIVELDAMGNQRRLRAANEAGDESHKIGEMDRLENMVQVSGGTQPMTALFKSQVDWQKHVRDSETRFALAQHRKGADNLLNRKRFLGQVTEAERETAKRMATGSTRRRKHLA